MEDFSADPDPPDAASMQPLRRRALGDALARLNAAQIAAGVPVAQIYGAGLPAAEVREQLSAALPTRFVPDDLVTWFGWRNGATSALAHHQAVLSPDGGDRLFGLSETIEWYERTIRSFRSLPADDPQALWAGLWALNLQLWSSTGSDQWFIELRPEASDPLPIQRIMLGDEPMAFRPPEPALPLRNLAAYIRHQARAWLELAMAESSEDRIGHPAGSPFAAVARAELDAEALIPVRPGGESSSAADFRSPESGSVPSSPDLPGGGFGPNLFAAASVPEDRRVSDGADPSPETAWGSAQDEPTAGPEGDLVNTTEGESIRWR
ncbi:MAG: hypothetical protein GY698_23500 [Actinomycetia bacterium]|nr:hypothetical protein [Actinomycetes bacterium]